MKYGGVRKGNPICPIELHRSFGLALDDKFDAHFLPYFDKLNVTRSLTFKITSFV